MTTPHTPPEDAFDQWLDALVDEEDRQLDDDRAEVAAFLQRHFALSTAEVAISESNDHAAPPSRAGKRPARATGSPRRAGIVPMGGAGTGWHIASLASAAVLVLIAIGMIGALLRMGGDDHHGGVSATASMLPFAPSPALASPTPAVCPTDDTLLLMPEEPLEPDAFADLAFPVAWYADGTLTVERHGEVLREIEIGEPNFLRPTSIPGVVLATTSTPGTTAERATLANITTGETAALGPYHRLAVTEGPYLFWASDGSYTRWSVTDLRTFDTVDLSERFPVEPLVSWRPYAGSLTTTTDGATVLIGTTSFTPVNATVTPATPVIADGPPLDISDDALLINGSLDDIQLIGPMSVTSSAMALSPNGSTVAWLAPSDQAGERTVTIADVASGDVLIERQIDVTYSNSLHFNADGTMLYATHGNVLESIPVGADSATPTVALETIELPDTSFRILAASPDHTKLLLARTTNASGERSLWVDITTGEVREISGTPARMFTGQIPQVSSLVNRYVLLDEVVGDIHVIDMMTGEVVLDEARGDAMLVSVSLDGSTLFVPQENGVSFWSLVTGRTTFHSEHDKTARTPTTFALTSNGTCAAGSWHLAGDEVESVLLSATSETSASLPPSTVGGWVPTDTHNP